METMCYTEKIAVEGVTVTQRLCTKTIHPVLEGGKGDTRVSRVCVHIAHFSHFVQRQSARFLAFMFVFYCLSVALNGLNPTAKSFLIVVRWLCVFKFSREIRGLVPLNYQLSGTLALNSRENLRIKRLEKLAWRLVSGGFERTKKTKNLAVCVNT